MCTYIFCYRQAILISLNIVFGSLIENPPPISTKASLTQQYPCVVSGGDNVT